MNNHHFDSNKRLAYYELMSEHSNPLNLAANAQGIERARNCRDESVFETEDNSSYVLGYN